jgi:hypothetical protein
MTRVRVPDQFVSIYVVLKKLRDKDEKGWILGRGVLNEVFVGLQVHSVLAPGVALGKCLEQQAEHLSVSRREDGLVFGVVLVLRSMDILVETFHRLIMVVVRLVVEGFDGHVRVVLEKLHAIRRVVIDVFAT